MPLSDDLLVLQRQSTGTHHKLNWSDLLLEASGSGDGSLGVHVGETPPPDPHEGDLWYQPSNEEFKIYLVDSATGVVTNIELRNGGSGYSVAQNLATSGGGGHELRVDVTSIDGTGKITSINLGANNGGHGYAVDDVVFLFNDGHANGSVLVKSVGSVSTGDWTVIDGSDGAGELWTEDNGKLYPTTLTNNVGIGTNAPAANLDIGSTGATNVPALYVSKTRGASTTSDIALSGSAVIASENALNHVVDSAGRFTWNIGGTSVTDGLTDAFEVMRIHPNGNVGIGTDSPIDQLQVVGHATIGMPNDFWQKGSGTYIATKNGFLGHNGANAVDLVCNGYRTGSGWKTLSADEGGSLIRLRRDGSIQFYGSEGAITGNDPSFRMIIKGTNGNVGIGVSEPAQKLHVNGTFQSNQAFMFADTPAAGALHIGQTGVSGYPFVVLADGTCRSPHFDLEFLPSLDTAP